MNAGHEFNYAVWTAGTTIDLCNVPWNSDYRDIVRFADTAALDNYLLTQAGPVTHIGGVQYAKFGQPVLISLPFNTVQTFNYLRASNPTQPVMGGDVPRVFYYFITDVAYVAPNTTEIRIQLDIWQTFGYGITFGNCYIERGHIGIANENAFDDYGREFLTIPEGLDMGGEYQIVDQWKEKVGSAKTSTEGVLDYSIMVVSTASLTAPFGTVDAPNLVSANGSTFENLPNGSEIYIFKDLPEFLRFTNYMADKPWITQGIISIAAIPPYERYNMILSETVISESSNVSVWEPLGEHPFQVNPVAMKTAWRETLPIPARYAHLDKFKVFPYTALEMTSYTGTPLMLKPESWANDDAVVVEMPHFAPPAPRLMFVPWRYNATGRAGVATGEIAEDFQDGLFNDGGEYLDMATGIMNFPTFSTTNNGYMSFMASNHNSVAFQHSSAEWAQQRALGGNALSYDNTNAQMELSKNLTGMQVSAGAQQTTLANETAGWQALKGAGNSIVGAASGVAQGGGVGAVLNGGMGLANSAADYAIGVNQRNQGQGISANLLDGSNKATVGTGAQINDSNRSYADYAARGDYQNQIAGIQAKVQDARLIQPTTSGQVGGDAFILAMYKWGYDVKVKMLQGAAINAIGEYWLRYGYQTNRFGKMPASFQVMTKFTYWKLRETYITGSACPETYKQAIRGIFEKGVTVWSNPADIGTIDIADNDALEGVSL
jgi:hypothetical protein